MRIALLQINTTIGDFSGNRARILGAYRQAVERGSEIAVAPELAVCGYPPRDLLLRDDFIDSNLISLGALAAEVGDVPLCVGYVERNADRPGKALRNAAAWLQNGKVVHRIFKSLLPTYDVFDEDRYFEPAPAVAPFEFKGLRIGVTICEDIWNDEDFWPDRLYRRDPVREVIRQGANLILNLSASPWHAGKEATRLAMLQKVARDEGVPLVQVNAVGANDELIFDGHSVIIDKSGQVLARAAGFAEEVLVSDVMGAPVIFPTVKVEEQWFEALALGIRDYVRKCGFHSVVLGLSGGIDSALVAVLAVRALGPDKVTGIALPSRYSSPGSLVDAEKLAKNLGIRYEVLPIDGTVVALEQMMSPVFAGSPDDITEENMQSRLRGTALMAFSNKFGALVLTTGNKSEMAVGYCTLYGDMCGALGVIADLWKTEVYALARWINSDYAIREGRKEIIPVSSIAKAPSAELRPDQTDQDLLPPYDLLDALLKLYVVEHVGRDGLIQHGYDPDVVSDVINKVTFSEYKRRQAAPGLKISSKAFGMGRRIPVAQRFKT